jgi:hypothetical protein
MWGLQLAPVTGRLVADLLEGRPDEQRLHPLRPERFAWRRRPAVSGMATEDRPREREGVLTR